MTSPLIAVLGRGIIGLSIVHRLVKEGHSVVVIGPRSAPGTATVAAQGVSSTKGLISGRAPLFKAKLLGHQGLPTWLDEVERDAGVRIPRTFFGAMEVAKSLGEYQVLAERIFHREFRGALGVRWIPRAEILERLGQSHHFLGGTSVFGGFFYPRDGWYCAESCRLAIEEFACKQRVLFVDAPVIRIRDDQSTGRFLVECAGSNVMCDLVVVAAGSETSQLLNNSGINHPVLRSVGGITVTAGGKHGDNFNVLQGKLSIVQAEHVLRVGSTTAAFDGISQDNHCLNHEISQLTADLGKTPFAGVINSLTPVRALWGLRVRTADRCPLLGPLQMPSGKEVLVATGFYKNALQLAHLAAKSVSYHVKGHQDRSIFREFSTNRFRN